MRNNIILTTCVTFLIIVLGYVIMQEDDTVKTNSSIPITTLFIDEIPKENLVIYVDKPNGKRDSFEYIMTKKSLDK